MARGENLSCCGFLHIIVYFPTVIQDSFSLSFKVQLCHPDFRGFGWIVTQCGAWKREEKIQMYTIEVQFPHKKIAVQMHGRGVGGFVNLLNNRLHSTI